MLFEKLFSVQDMLAFCGILFLIVKIIQRHEGWGWSK